VQGDPYLGEHIREERGQRVVGAQKQRMTDLTNGHGYWPPALA